ncbi:riboflavin synthase [Sulfuricurvum sp.]|uniref:riboflavin synthase n=1 Tax=Sulfuricurvum sp. TaxID=2025608 RepID=UPI0026361512|nr:riboflavin synthase [Sulfuricurvum sp.]MDD2265840.1 riboflavin synthase [Sulfuricurvum sp.]MDD2784522.1 riboflavin synthase [Sulfuricurvum sp.]
MFTGLIREMATVKSFGGNRLALKAAHKPKLGDSIAINGTCLSVVSIESDGFSVELSPETLSHIATEKFSGKVHIEPAMMMGDRFEGHIVQGHVDTIGTIRSITDNGNSYDVIVDVDAEFIPLIPPKGSITIDGISLTVNEVMGDAFRLTIIPITMRETLFGTYKKGTRVNIETDVFARYMRHILTSSNTKTMSWNDVDHISALY